MSGESHAYGTALLCIGRRHFVLLVCFFFSWACWIRIGLSIVHSNVLVEYFTDKAAAAPGCSGMECYEVFTCKGLREATQHMREPISTLTGALVFPLGFIGAHHGYRTSLAFVANYTMLLVVGAVVLAGADVLYTGSCNAYPVNMVHLSLRWGILAPLTRATETQLGNMEEYPKSVVDEMVGAHFSVTLWYLTVAFGYVVIFGYLATQARLLSHLVERGPLGLGVYYGLDQWDEEIHQEALAIRMTRKLGSKFVQDGQVDLASLGFNLDNEALGYGLTSRAGGMSYMPGDEFYGATEPEERITMKQLLVTHADMAAEEADEEEAEFLEEVGTHAPMKPPAAVFDEEEESEHDLEEFFGGSIVL